MRYEDVLSKVGELGPYQILVSVLMSLMCLPVAWYPAQEVFSNPLVNHWCSVPEIRDQCEEWGLDEAACDEKVIAVGIPPAEPGENALAGNSHCRRYNLTEVQVTFNTTSDDFNRTIIDCDGEWDFDKSVYQSTVRGQFKLVCEQSLLAELPLTIFGVAGMFGVTIFGVLGDRFGRRKMFVVALLIQGATGLAYTFSPSFAVYFVFRTLVGFVNTSVVLCGFILIIEIVGITKRDLTRTLLMCVTTLGVSCLAGISWFVRWWRGYTLIISLAGIAFTFLFPFIPESPVWQLTVGKVDEAEKNLRRMARFNRAELPDQLFTEEDIAVLKGEEQATVFDLLKSRILRLRQLILCWMTLCIALSLNGLTLNSGNIGTNDHLSFVLLTVVELPGFTVAYLVMNRVGRKWALVGSFLVAGAGCIATAFVEPGSVAQTVLAIIGKFGVSGALCVSDLFAAELLPTQVRNAGGGLNGMAFGLGATLAPYMNRVQIYWAPATMLIFGILSLSAGIPVFLFLPETRGRPIPNTIEEGENYGKKPKDKKPENTYGIYDDTKKSSTDMDSVEVMNNNNDVGIDNLAAECTEEELVAKL